MTGERCRRCGNPVWVPVGSATLAYPGDPTRAGSWVYFACVACGKIRAEGVTRGG